MFDERERWRRFAQGDHVRPNGRATLRSRIRLQSSEIIAPDSQSFGPAVFARHAIDPGSVLYVVRKPSPSGP